MSENGTPHRRDDGELLGWIRPDGDLWAAIDVLGRPVAEGVEWLDAEAALEEHGISWLADSWLLDLPPAGPLRVRILEVTPDETGKQGRIVVAVDDFGDMTRPPASRTVLSWPLPAELRLPRDGDPDPRVIG